MWLGICLANSVNQPFAIDFLQDNDVIVALARLSEKEAPQILFPKVDGKLDYMGFKAVGEEAHKWCRDVFMYCWEKASKEMPERLRDILGVEW